MCSMYTFSHLADTFIQRDLQMMSIEAIKTIKIYIQTYKCIIYTHIHVSTSSCINDCSFTTVSHHLLTTKVVLR